MVKRHKMAKRFSRKVFHKHSKSKSKNHNATPMRGGWRI